MEKIYTKSFIQEKDFLNSSLLEKDIYNQIVDNKNLTAARFGNEFLNLGNKKCICILNAIYNNKSIKHLSFEGDDFYQCPSDIIDEIYKCLKENILSLGIRTNLSIPSYVTNLIEKLNTTNLECLNINGCFLACENESYANYLLRSIAKKKWDCLQLGSNYLESSDFVGSVLKDILNCTNALNISKNRLTWNCVWKDWNDYFKIINKNDKFRSLILIDVGLNLMDELIEFRELFLEFVENTKIKNFDITYNDLSDDFTMSLIEKSKTNKFLTLKTVGNNADLYS